MKHKRKLQFLCT